ncbi:MAG: hypothetical protein K2N48_11010 [Muribaculaceae bacterium]|nr:hypothetical protein [Muribaculaceae bacterium]
MKIYNILGVSAAIFAAFAFSSCAEDKFYDMGGTMSNRVVFKAVNLTVGNVDEAVSTGSDDRYYLPDRNVQFSLDVYDPYSYDGEEMSSEEVTIKIDKESKIWTGGYNDIEITFEPSAPEEKEATFTMPDGSTFTASRENPTFIWTPDSTFASGLNSDFIIAESHYKKGNDTYDNVGFIFVEVQGYVRYNSDNNRWYRSYWMDGESISVDYYVKFTAENLTMGSSTFCTSYNFRFPFTETPREETITIPYIGYSGNESSVDLTLSNSYYLYACGENDIRFTFIPQEGEEEMLLSFPNGLRITLTADDPTYIWHATYEDIINYDYDYIVGTSTFVKDGIHYYCDSIVRLISIRNLWYDANSGVFRSEYWY